VGWPLKRLLTFDDGAEKLAPFNQNNFGGATGIAPPRKEVIAMLDINRLRLLDHVTIPEALEVHVTDDTNEFMSLRAVLNNSAPQLFGVAYRQGNRLHFGTGMSVRDYAKMVKLDQAKKGSTVSEARGSTNRPKEASHGRGIAEYLNQTACIGQPFIFPSFVVNYGLGWNDSKPKAQLTIFAGSRDALAWPAIFSPPAEGGLPVTDGGHRTDEINKKLDGETTSLPDNALSIIFVFEDDIDSYHQDFADCAKAKKISDSIMGTWDRRNLGRRFGTDLVTNNKHLRGLIDATSNSVNLSNNARKAWSMSALHSAVEKIYRDETSTRRLSDFFDTVFAAVPILEEISPANGAEPKSAAEYRKERGGCVLLRGVGLAVLTQAYIHAIKNNIPFVEMAGHLAKLDWYTLKQDAPLQGEDEDAHTYVSHAAQPIWKNMVAVMMGERGFRLKGTRDAAEKSFQTICAQLNI
jgi:hypothetical protein